MFRYHRFTQNFDEAFTKKYAVWKAELEDVRGWMYRLQRLPLKETFDAEATNLLVDTDRVFEANPTLRDTLKGWIEAQVGCKSEWAWAYMSRRGSLYAKTTSPAEGLHAVVKFGYINGASSLSAVFTRCMNVVSSRLREQAAAWQRDRTSRSVQETDSSLCAAERLVYRLMAPSKYRKAFLEQIAAASAGYETRWSGNYCYLSPSAPAQEHDDGGPGASDSANWGRPWHSRERNPRPVCQPRRVRADTDADGVTVLRCCACRSSDTKEEGSCTWRTESGLPCKHELAANGMALPAESLPARWWKKFAAGKMDSCLPRVSNDMDTGLTASESALRALNEARAQDERDTECFADRAHDEHEPTDHGGYEADDDGYTDSAGCEQDERQQPGTPTLSAELAMKMVAVALPRKCLRGERAAAVISRMASELDNIIRSVQRELDVAGADARFDEIVDASTRLVAICSKHAPSAAELHRLLVGFSMPGFSNPVQALAAGESCFDSWYQHLRRQIQHVASVAATSEATTTALLAHLRSVDIETLLKRVPVVDTASSEPRYSQNCPGQQRVRKRKISLVRTAGRTMTANTTKQNNTKRRGGVKDSAAARARAEVLPDDALAAFGQLSQAQLGRLLCNTAHHARDERIGFNRAAHTYFIDGVAAPSASVTQKVANFTRPFDGPRIAAGLARHAKSGTYYRRSVKEILAMWDTAAAAGTALHADIEFILNGLEPTRLSMEPAVHAHFNAFQAAAAAQGLTPYRTEWRIFDEIRRLCGTVDAIYRRADGKYVLIDWKRSNCDHSRKAPKMRQPLGQYADNKLTRWSLQLNLYKFILETYYGVDIAEMRLVFFHPLRSGFESVAVDDMAAAVQAMLNTDVDAHPPLAAAALDLRAGMTKLREAYGQLAQQRDDQHAPVVFPSFDSMTRVELCRECMLRNIKRSRGMPMTTNYMKTRLAKWNSTHQTHALVRGVLRAASPAGNGATCGLWRNSVSGTIVAVSQGTLATLGGGWTVPRVKQRWGPSGTEHQPGPNDTELVRFSFNSASDGSLVLPEEAFRTWKYFAVPFQLEWSHNNCWLATALQALCACPQFLDTWRRPQLAQRSDLRNSQHAEKVAVAVPAFLSGVLATASHAPNGALIAQLRLQLGARRPNFSGDSMHDVADVLLWLLDQLHSETTVKNTAKDSSRIRPHSTCDDTDPIVLAEEHAWNELHNSSPTASLFRGMMRTKIDCTQCARSTRRFETFTIVCFAIPPPPPPPPPSASSDSTDAGSPRAAPRSLEQLMEANLIHHKETMADGVDCPDCHARTKHTRQDAIATTPTYLIIQVKRWTKEGEKIKGQITSPPMLNMHSCVTAPTGAGSNVYRRVAIVEHRDGHYTAYVTRDAASFLCDGSRVTQVSEAAMNSCHDAYVFVYARVAPDVY